MWNVCAFYKVVNIQFSTHYEKYERNLKPQMHKKADWKKQHEDFQNMLKYNRKV